MAVTVFFSVGGHFSKLLSKFRAFQDLLERVYVEEGVFHEFNETCYSVTFIVVVNSHQR